MKKTIINKEFDAVKFMRQQRDRISGTRVILYPGAMSNQGQATIKIMTREGYQLILRFDKGF